MDEAGLAEVRALRADTPGEAGHPSVPGSVRCRCLLGGSGGPPWEWRAGSWGGLRGPGFTFTELISPTREATAFKGTVIFLATRPPHPREPRLFVPNVWVQIENIK